MTFVLTMLGAALACAVEMLEALAIVLAVALTRRTRDALLGALGALVSCVLLAALLGPLLLARAGGAPLRLIVGVALLFFGLEWLRKAILRLAGRRSLSSAFREFVEEQEVLEQLSRPAPGQADWAARTIAFKGVLLEGVEIVLIVTALASRPAARVPALLGAGVALVATVLIGALLHRPLRRLPETHMKYVVGILLSTFGTFFTAEGLAIPWPLGDATLLVLVAIYLAASRAMIFRVARRPNARTDAVRGSAGA